MKFIKILIFLLVLLNAESMEYKKAIELARNGELDKSILLLKTLYIKNSEDKKLFYDYITVLGWAQKDKEIIKLLKNYNYVNLPDNILEIIAKAYRNTKNYKMSIYLYRLCLQKKNNNRNCKYGLILSLSDNKQFKKALKELAVIKDNNYYYFFVKGYILESARRYYDSFINYQKAYELNNKDADSLKGLVRTLDMLGLPYLAYEYLKRNPKIFDENYIYRLKKDQIAFKIRWGELITVDTEKRFKETDEALERLNKLISSSKAKHLKEENPNILQARFDKLVALRDRFYMNEVIKEYKMLEKENIELPYYALNAVADAYLYNKKPEIAIKFYKKTLKKYPNHFESKIGIFYCYVEMFKLNEAIKWIDNVDKNEPAWIRGKFENEYKVESSTTAALARYFADYMDEAQKRLEKMCNTAPANVDIRIELANLYKDRGWDRKAIEEADFALAYEKDNKDANLVKALACLDINKFKESEGLITKLYKKYPEDLQIQKAKKHFEIYKDKYQLLIDAVAGSTNGKNFGNNYFEIDTKFYSKPIKYYYKLYLLSYYSKGIVEKGEEVFKRLGIALEYRKNNFISNIGVLQNKNIDKKSWFVDSQYFFSDKWILYGLYESYSKETPLKALKNNIYAKRMDVVLTYRGSESRETNIEFEKMDFNDSNKRKTISFFYYERMITGPYYKLNVTFSYSMSSNTYKDALYFNPEKDRYIGINLENLWHLYRRYSNAFSHVLGLRIGSYWQKGYSSHPIWSIRYEHRWEIEDSFDLIYGVSRDKNYYGEKEFDTSFYLTLDRRF